MLVSDDNLMDILQIALYKYTDLGYAADGTQKSGIKRGEMLIFLPDENNRPIKIQLYYKLDLKTGEVTFTYP